MKISTNEIEITNLTTGETINRRAAEDFSTIRIVVSSFNRIHNLMLSLMKEMNIPSFRITPVKMLIQQIEKLEGGLSDIEKRALRDIGEQSGAKYVIVVEHANKLTNEEAMIELARKE